MTSTCRPCVRVRPIARDRLGREPCTGPAAAEGRAEANASALFFCHLAGEESALVACRGIRGATTVSANTRDEILRATRELLRRIVDRHAVAVESSTALFFTAVDLPSPP